MLDTLEQALAHYITQFGGSSSLTPTGWLLIVGYMKEIVEMNNEEEYNLHQKLVNECHDDLK